MNLRTAFRRLERSELEAECRRLAVTKYCGNSVAITRVLHRFNLFVDTRDRGEAPHLMMDGFWKMWSTRAIVERVQQGWRCADIGASFGYFSMLLADLSERPVSAFAAHLLILDSARLNGLKVMMCGRGKMSKEEHGAFAFVNIVDPDSICILRSLGDTSDEAQVLLETRGSELRDSYDWIEERYSIEEVSPGDTLFKPTDKQQLIQQGAVWLWLTPK